jgi:dihydrofolate reductase
MRKIILAMMTTLNGRLDEPFAWMNGVDDEHYKEIRDAFESFDSILVGRVTFGEMADYWPGAEKEDGSDINRSMAGMMNTYQKFVFSSDHGLDTSRWNNARVVPAGNDNDIIRFSNQLKAQPGKNIHLAGGARLAQTFVRLGLIDEYRLSIYPLVSLGASWFDKVSGTPKMFLLGSRSYKNGVTRLDYMPDRDAQVDRQPQTFTEMIR